MKSIINKITLLFALLIVVVSCDTNSAYQYEPAEYNPDKFVNVYMYQATSTPVKRVIQLNGNTQVIYYNAAYAGAHPATKDITVHFNVKPALVDSFNLKNMTTYSTMTKNSYKLTAKKAIIPEGRRSTDRLKLKIFTNKHVKPGKQYLLPVTVNVNGNVPVDDKLRTAYFLIMGKLHFISKSNWQVIDWDHSRNANHPPSNAIDGNKNTYWSEEKPGGADVPHWIVVDMSKSYTIYGFKIYAKNHHPGFHPKKIKLQFSDDGTNWKYSEKFTLPSNNELNTKVYLSHSVNARYFKFTVLTTARGFRTSHVYEISTF